MKDKSAKEIIITAVSLFLICAVSAGILGVVNNITSPVIKDIQAKAADQAKADVLPAAVTFEDLGLADAEGYAGKDAAGQIVGYVFVTSASSYGGKLELMTGIDAEGKVTGINPLTIDDTPGLGMKAKNPDEQAKWIGKSSEIKVIKNGTPADDEVVAITSATITTTAVTNCVNQALALYAQAAGKEA